MFSTSDKDFYQLTISITKALNPMEAPLKIKHVRSVIIASHRTKEAKSLWTVITRQPLMEQRFTAWKFCHLFHKVLREGHESVIKQSQYHKKMIYEMGKLWSHLNDGVGTCIYAYSKLLVTKLDFHEKNTVFPGSLVIDFRDIEKFAGKDINVYFQICVEMFDYLDDIIDVQSKVFSAVNSFRMSSMSPQGQCRLAPLITLIQDCNPLYDKCVRVLFKLHDELPSEILCGHRNRFKEILTKLKFFYDSVRPLQYFFDLIQVPHLPETIPNFCSKKEFGSYVTPVVFVQPDSEQFVDIDVDSLKEEQEQVYNHCDRTLIKEEQAQQGSLNNDAINTLENSIKDKDFVIMKMQEEINAFKTGVTQMEKQYENQILEMSKEINTLKKKISISKELYETLEKEKENLKDKLTKLTLDSEKTTEEEAKLKMFEDKFDKLKVMYTHIRDEHIHLLRQHSESTKQFSKEKQSNKHFMDEIEYLKNQNYVLQEEIQKKYDLSNENIELQLSVDKITNQTIILTEANKKMNQDYEELQLLKNIEITDISAKYFKLQEDHEALKMEHSIQKNLIQKYEHEINQTKNDILEKDKKTESYIQVKSTELNNANQCLLEVKSKFENENSKAIRLSKEKLILENKLHDLAEENVIIQNDYGKVLAEKESLEISNEELKTKHNSMIKSLLCNILNILEHFINELHSTKRDSDYSFKKLEPITKIKSFLNEFHPLYMLYYDKKDNSAVERLVKYCILTGCNFIKTYEQCLSMFKTMTQVDKENEIYCEASSICKTLLNLFNDLAHSGREDRLAECISQLNLKLSNLDAITTDFLCLLNGNSDLETLVNKEINEMDEKIEEAVIKFLEMLSSAKKMDCGIKLEVNEKILDACTTLLNCIKVLIEKSKILQEEIVSNGRGTTTVQEFYKRNSQWTEGLLSASKNIAKGANFLVDSANKAINSESNDNFEILVAAQEIAASTAQLVIASKVKAHKDSFKLKELIKASRNVSEATGAVIATVKDYTQHLEKSWDVDISKLTTSQAKTMEIEIHVKVLELEKALDLERVKLSSFRRSIYHNEDN